MSEEFCIFIFIMRFEILSWKKFRNGFLQTSAAAISRKYGHTDIESALKDVSLFTCHYICHTTILGELLDSS